MQHRKLAAATILFASAAFTLQPNAPAPVPGPGGVIDAVTKFLEATDARDAATLALLVDDHGDSLHDYATSGSVDGKPLKVSPAAFYECDEAGQAWQAGDKASLLAKLTTPPAATRTQVRSVRANCLSARCSYAMVEFDRISGEGDATVTVPMRATALLRYAPTEGGPSFKLYHWHASRGPRPATDPKPTVGAKR